MYVRPDESYYDVNNYEVMGDNDEDSFVDNMTNYVEMMGWEDYLDDPELMGGFLRRLFKRIKKRIRARRARRKAAGAPPVDDSVLLRTPAGTASIGPDGVSLTKPAPLLPKKTAKAGFDFDSIMNNPMAIVAIGLLIMVLMKRK